MLSADVTYPENVDGVNYEATLRTGMEVGTCSVTPASNFPPLKIDALIDGTGTDFADTVPSGSCRVFELTILRVGDNTIMDTSTVTVDNI